MRELCLLSGTGPLRGLSASVHQCATGVNKPEEHAIGEIMADGSASIPLPKGTVVDLFCGVGGLAHGFHLEGFPIGAGVDVDGACRYAFETNNDSTFLKEDVGTLTADQLRPYFVEGQPKILVGCAPCQPFSTYTRGGEQKREELVDRFADIICDLEPEIVSMENVPRLVKYRDGEVLRSFVSRLEAAKYNVSCGVVFAPDYGVPQRRSRLVLLASRLGKIALEAPSHARGGYRTVEEVIGNLPPIAAGEAHADDPLHRSSRVSTLNLRRLKASVPGGTWRDWDEELVAACHRAETGKTYPGVYGRMRADGLAPTMTTQFFGFGNGRFGHPTQDRAISLREGALLQSFPEGYQFVEPGRPIAMKVMGKLIGNAVPVALSRAIARSIKSHLGAQSAWASNSN